MNIFYIVLMACIMLLRILTEVCQHIDGLIKPKMSKLNNPNKSFSFDNEILWIDFVLIRVNELSKIKTKHLYNVPNNISSIC